MPIASRKFTCAITCVASSTSVSSSSISGLAAFSLTAFAWTTKSLIFCRQLRIIEVRIWAFELTIRHLGNAGTSPSYSFVRSIRNMEPNHGRSLRAIAQSLRHFGCRRELNGGRFGNELRPILTVVNDLYVAEAALKIFHGYAPCSSRVRSNRAVRSA